MIEVNPIDDSVLEFIDETVVVTLTADPTYIIAAPADATVAIVSDEARPIVTLSRAHRPRCATLVVGKHHGASRA